MDVNVRHESEARGELVRLSTGEEGVRVRLCYRPKLHGGSIEGRLRALEVEFGRFARQLGPLGVELQPQSISVSAQTVYAVLAVDRLQEIEDDLARQQVRIDYLGGHGGA